MNNKIRAALRAFRTVITSMVDIAHPRFFISRYRGALWEIENPQTQEPPTESCDGCDKQFDPELITICNYTESDGNIASLQFCPSCISD